MKIITFYYAKIIRIFCVIFFLFSLIINLANLNAQHVEIQGKAKVAIMDTLNTESLLVVKQADGTLATRQVSSLPPDQPDTVRNMATDFELAKYLCACDNNLPPFLVESTLAGGYTVKHLFDAGVPVSNLAAGGAPAIDLYDLGVSVSELLSAGYTPMDIYDNGNGAPVKSFWGKYYQGGYIFYLDTLDVHPSFEGLVCGTTDYIDYAWRCTGTEITGADVSDVGAGQNNTLLIVCDECHFNDGVTSAAELCDSLKIAGYDDWWLPSKDELTLMWLNLADSDGNGANTGPMDAGNLGNFITDAYWSSTESNASEAWYRHFSNGFSTDALKGFLFVVRAVRAF